MLCLASALFMFCLERQPVPADIALVRRTDFMVGERSVCEELCAVRNGDVVLRRPHHRSGARIELHGLGKAPALESTVSCLIPLAPVARVQCHDDGDGGLPSVAPTLMFYWASTYEAVPYQGTRRSNSAPRQNCTVPGPAHNTNDPLVVLVVMSLLQLQRTFCLPA